MELIDKRQVCGCHAGCSTIEHTCDKPCVWPLCLTEAEHHALVDGAMRGWLGDSAFPSPGASA